MSEEEADQEGAWPPAPERVEGGSVLDVRATNRRPGAGVYILCLILSFLYWLATWTLSRYAVDFMFPSITLIQSVYFSAALRAMLGLAVALVLILRKSRFGKPVLIGMLLTASLFTGFEFFMQPFWQ